MKKNFRSLLTAAAVLVLSVGASEAQSPGYVGGNGGPVPAFNPQTGELLNPIELPEGSGGNVGVSPDGSTVYAATGYQPKMLGAFSAATGQMLTEIDGVGTCLFQSKIVMAPGGQHAFVMCQATGAENSVAIVNLATQSVGAYLHVQGGEPADIAISPNGKQFFLSTTKTGTGVSVQGRGTAPANTVQRPVYECAQVPGVCVFNTSTFALAAQVSVPAGHLAISQDGGSLYVWDATTFGQPFYVVNTTSLAVSAIGLPDGALAYTMAVSPVGNVAVLSAFTQSGGQPYYLLDTQTNHVTGTFPAPLFPPGIYPTFGSNVIAFSLDGTSVWSVGCNGNCSAVSGQSFPSGDTIAEISLGSNYNALAITF
jgi:DNA-binding beta-propeller fold protein YncE